MSRQDKRMRVKRSLFGGPLRGLREQVGISQQELAERIGISPAFMSHLELGRRVATEDMLARIGAALGVEADQLVDLNHASRFARLPEDLQTWIEARVVSAPSADDLFETQLSNARDGHFAPGDRITTLAVVVDGVRQLDADDLLRVSGFLAGLKAAKQ